MVERAGNLPCQSFDRKICEITSKLEAFLNTIPLLFPLLLKTFMRSRKFSGEPATCFKLANTSMGQYHIGAEFFFFLLQWNKGAVFDFCCFSRPIATQVVVLWVLGTRDCVKLLSFDIINMFVSVLLILLSITFPNAFSLWCYCLFVTWLSMLKCPS